MAITHIAKTATMGSGTGAISVGVPSGYAEGDLLLLILQGYDAIPDEPVDWTTIDTQTNTKTNLRVCYKISTSSESTVTVADSGDSTRGLMVCFRGVDTTTPIHAYTKNAISGDYFEATNPTTTVAGCMIVNCVGFYDADANDTSNYTTWYSQDLVSITEGHDQATSAGSGGGIAYAYGTKSTAGTVRASYTSTDNAANSSAAVSIALTPAIIKKTLTALVGATGTVLRKTKRTLTTSVSALGTIAYQLSEQAQQFTKALTASISTLSVTRRKVVKINIASLSASTTVRRATKRNVTATILTTVSVLRKIARALSTAVSTTSTAIRESIVRTYKTLTASVSVSASALRKTAKALAVSVSTFTHVKRSISKLASAITHVSSARKSAIRRTLTATTEVSTTIKRVAHKSISSLVSVSTAITRTKALLKVLSATVGAVSTATKAISKTTTATVILSASRVSVIVADIVEKIYLTAIHSLTQTITAINRIPTLALSAVLHKPLSVSTIKRNIKATMTVTTNNNQEVTWTMGADPKGNTIYMVLGETKTIELTVLTTAGAAADLAGATAKFRAEGFTADKDCTIVSNVISVDLVAADFSKSGSYGYEFRIKDALNNVDSLVRGKVVVEPRLVTTF